MLKEGSLPLVWRETKGLMRLDSEKEHRLEQTWRGRHHVFRSVNGIEHEYGQGRHREYLKIHLVVCDESW